ncbi:MAG: VWA domain-containing protein [Polyangiaceae bacterium]|nr:VWA domain-containing protein [Polyangiaceae bacterium]
MNLHRIVSLSALSTVASTCVVFGCDPGANTPPQGAISTGNRGNSGSGSASGTGGTGSVLGNTGGIVIGTGGDENTGGIVACKAQEELAKLTPVNIVFMIDKSGSMGAQDVNGDGDYDDENEWDRTEVRWAPVRDALVAFFENPGAEGLGAALEFFPIGGQPTAPDTGVCRVGEYANPSVRLQSLDDPTKREQLVTRIQNTTPGGGTPTLPAVQGAIQYATELLVADPSSTSVIVLVTDGEPGVSRVVDGVYTNEKCFCYGTPGCTDEDEIPYVQQAVADAAMAGIPTYVIGMGEVDPGNLNMIAEAGGTESAYVVDIGDYETTKAQLAEALTSVQGVQAPCNLQIPAAPDGETFDKSKVNVEYVTGAGLTTQLYYAGTLVEGAPLTCPAAGPPPPPNPWFWTYDNDANPSQIVLCPSACNQMAGDAGGQVKVAYGCEIIPPPIL